MSADDIFWLIVAFLVFGGGEVVVRIFAPLLSSQRTVGRLKAENKALRARTKALTVSGGPATVTDPRLESLLWRVQAADEALPQLGATLRRDIDTVLADCVQRDTPRGS